MPDLAAQKVDICEPAFGDLHPMRRGLNLNDVCCVYSQNPTNKTKPIFVARREFILLLLPGERRDSFGVEHVRLK